MPAEMERFCRQLMRSPIVARGVLVVATGRASLSFEKETAAKVADVVGRSLSADEFRELTDQLKMCHVR